MISLIGSIIWRLTDTPEIVKPSRMGIFQLSRDSNPSVNQITTQLEEL
jgi:hypothetical protein